MAGYDPFASGPTPTQQMVAAVVGRLMPILDSKHPPQVQVGALRTALHLLTRDVAPPYHHPDDEETP